MELNKACTQLQSPNQSCWGSTCPGKVKVHSSNRSWPTIFNRQPHKRLVMEHDRILILSTIPWSEKSHDCWLNWKVRADQQHSSCRCYRQSHLLPVDEPSDGRRRSRGGGTSLRHRLSYHMAKSPSMEATPEGKFRVRHWETWDARFLPTSTLFEDSADGPLLLQQWKQISIIRISQVIACCNIKIIIF